MATAKTVDIDPDANKVQIRELSVTDDELVGYLSEFEDEQQREAIEQALKVGAATLNLAETSKDLEYVKHEFDRMHQSMTDEIDDVQEEMDAKLGEEGRLSRLLDSHFGDDGTLRDHLNDAFGDDGIFTERLDEELGENGERIQDALDPDKEGTPTYRLQKRIEKEIDSIRQRLDEEAGEEEIRQRTTLKGEDFERDLEAIIEDLVSQTPHTYEFTGETEGELTGRDVGDFVIDLGDTGQRIVVEAKSDKSYNKPDIKEEMEDAIENRMADYGIFVTECESYIPNEVGYLQEFDQQYVSVALCEDEDDEIDPRLFRIGYNWAKMRAAQAAVDANASLDPETIQTKVEEVDATVDRFREIKKKCTNIKKGARGIEDELDEIQDDVVDQLNAIRAELSKSEA